MGRQETLQSRSAPVLGRSKARLRTGPENAREIDIFQACCARGRAHSGVVHLADRVVRASPGADWRVSSILHSGSRMPMKLRQKISGRKPKRKHLTAFAGTSPR